MEPTDRAERAPGDQNVEAELLVRGVKCAKKKVHSLVEIIVLENICGYDVGVLLAILSTVLVASQPV